MEDSRIRFESHSLAPGFDLHLHTSKKQKTNRLSLAWVSDLTSDVTERALLPALLSRGTRAHSTLREVSRHLEHLYGATLAPDVMKIGERHAVVFRFDFANDHFLPRGEAIFDDAIAFFRDVISDPYLEGSKFPSDVVHQEKENHRKLIESLYNDKGSYALQQCIEEMCKGEEFRRYEHGSVEDLPDISADDLARQWQLNFTRSPTHVYFSGDVDVAAASAALAPLARGREGSPTSPADLRPLRGASEVRELEERMDVQQTKLVLGYRTETRLGDSGLEALAIANGILGLFPHSKLFLNVREKASLCYYANSALERTHGLLFITSGIDSAKKDEALALIQKQVEDLKEGNITDDEMASTLAAFDNRLLMLEDRPGIVMDIDLSWRLAGVEYDHEKYRRRLAAVTKEAVAEAAQRLQLDTIYALCPRENGS